MQKVLLLVFIFSLSTSLFSQEKKVLTLEEAIKIVLNNNTSLNKIENQLTGSKKKIKSSYGDFLPNLGVRGGFNWSRTSDDGGQQLDFFGNPIAIPASKIDSRNYSLSAGGSWVLFNGLSNYNSLKQSKTDYKSFKYDYIKNKQNTILETMSRFYNVLNTREQMKVREDNVKFNNKLLETIKERNRLGSVAIADVYTQQVQLGNAELALIRAENDFETAKVVLLNYLGLEDVLSEYSFVDPRNPEFIGNRTAYMNEFSEVSDMVADALDNRFDYKSKELGVTSAEYGVDISKSGYMPNLTGNYGFSASSVKINNVFDRRQYSLGLTLNVPIFSNFNTEYSVQLAKINLKNSIEDLSAAKRLIKVEVKQGYQDAVAAKKALDVSIENIKAAEERRKINYERYNLGSGTILDVLQADRDYTQALSDNINVEFAFYKAVDNLKNYLGKIDYKKYE